jgi:uncharacterized protein YbjT (DUF2867 family)
LIPALLKRGHQIRALVRAGSERKLPAGCTPVLGNTLDADSYAQQVPPSDTLVQLVGTPKPSPRKAQQFREVDFKSGMAAVEAAKHAGIRLLVYVSVAHPAPMPLSTRRRESRLWRFRPSGNTLEQASRATSNPKLLTKPTYPNLVREEMHTGVKTR